MEFARTRLSSVEIFDRDEMPRILNQFSANWNFLENLDDDVPQARFAFFDITWDRPNTKPG